jgi:predicted transcriptional regulator
MRRRSRLPQLGELERAILRRLWSHGPADVKAMQRSVGEVRGIKPNTVQSTLDRLHRKGLAERERVGRAYVYRARVSQRQWVVRALEAVLGDVPRRAPDLLLSAFVDLAERTGTEQLEELERLVRARRTRGKEDGS